MERCKKDGVNVVKDFNLPNIDWDSHIVWSLDGAEFVSRIHDCSMKLYLESILGWSCDWGMSLAFGVQEYFKSQLISSGLPCSFEDERQQWYGLGSFDDKKCYLFSQERKGNISLGS